ncbi:hypothetical protein LCGC14_0870620 [marine sediment metagenome]|uniref:Uncharacterized protein n=1 Tax=marine sediment metagenome TaxID=412755 RepID=A0A0F9PQG6_9ZZZZ
MAETQQGLKLLIMGFVTIIIGLVLIQVIADDVERVKIATIPIVNESLASGTTITLANDELTIFSGLRNLTTQNIVITQCNSTLATGVLVCNSTKLESTVNADYTYIPDNFVRDSTSRTILSLTILFFAIGIMALGIGFTIAGFRQSGVM